MADRSKLHTDLMRSSGVEFDLHKRQPVSGVCDFVVQNRLFCARNSAYVFASGVASFSGCFSSPFDPGSIRMSTGTVLS